MHSTRAQGAAALALSVTVITGCSSTGSVPTADHASTAAATTSATASATPSTSSATGVAFNATDVAFATTIDQLDNQVHRLAAMVPTRTAHHDLTTLGTAITQHHLDMTELPPRVKAGLPTGATSPTQPSAMLPEAAFHTLSSMHGDAFDNAWLEHAAGTYTAIDALCRDELAHGIDPHARALAARELATQPSLLNQVQHYHDAWMHDAQLGNHE